MPHIILTAGGKIPVNREEYEVLIDHGRFNEMPKRFGEEGNLILVSGLHIAAVLPTEIEEITIAQDRKARETLTIVDRYVQLEVQKTPQNKGLQKLKLILAAAKEQSVSNFDLVSETDDADNG